MSASQDNKKASTSVRLVGAALDLEQSLQIFEEINQKAAFIALCASIEGARMRGKLGTFSIVANQISEQASKNGRLSEKLRQLVDQMKTEALDAVAIRNMELALDLIDKLDRNLFERNCDVQAWAGFDVVRGAIVERNDDSVKAAAAQLAQLVDIYQVYHDSFLLDFEGTVVACARSSQSQGLRLAAEPWFLSALKGEVTVTDAHHSQLIDKNVVMYCAPVMSEGGEIIGVLANFFNWDFALEMLESAGLEPELKAVVVDRTSRVIASRLSSQIMNDRYDWLSAGENAVQGGVGYSVEGARNGQYSVYGYAHTKGYNAYRGKSWTAIISESVEVELPKVRLNQVEKRGADGSVEKLVASEKITSELSGERLLKTMQDIDNLVEEINSNNREVKLLAVNASIQAGLAGSEGEGFSIIANEVAQLAKKSLSFVEFVNRSTENLRGVVAEAGSTRLLDAARDAMSKVDRNLFERYCDIQAWATFSKFPEILLANKKGDREAQLLLAKIHKIYEVYHDLYVLNREGEIVAVAIDQSALGKNLASMEAFQAALSGKTFYTDLMNSQFDKHPVMFFSNPVLGPRGEVLGVILSRFNWNFIQDIIRVTTVDSMSEAFLINSEGQIIASRGVEELLSIILPEVGEFGEYKKAHSHLMQVNGHVLGIANSPGYNTFKSQEWTLVCKRPLSQDISKNRVTPEQRFRMKMNWAV